MASKTYDNFSVLSQELCKLLSYRVYDKEKVNSLIDELNAKTFKAELFARNQDVVSLVAALCSNIRPVEESLAAKTSHLIINIMTKQSIKFTRDNMLRSISWHIDCLKNCSDIVMPDILNNLEYILQCDPVAGLRFSSELLGSQGILLNIINIDKSHNLKVQNPLQTSLIAMKCILCLLKILEDEKKDQTYVTLKMKEEISIVTTKFLMNTQIKPQDEFLYCKAVTYALRILSHLYLNDKKVEFSLPDAMGISRYFVLYGVVEQKGKPERIMPSQQTIAAVPEKINPKGGKKPLRISPDWLKAFGTRTNNNPVTKQKVRRHRNNAVENLKKGISVSDRSLMKDVGAFENTSAYKPVLQNYLESQKEKECLNLTSDSDMSDMEDGREVKLIALKARVRQSASNLFLVLFKIKEKKDIFGYWWALLPDSPNVNNMFREEPGWKTLAYCALYDPFVSSRASVISVILGLLAGSRVYLLQAETCKKVTTSFIPFSISLGYIATCMHKVLTNILDNDRSHSVILMALKCCVALVQATPYHKMQEGLISDLVRPLRKFLVHRDVQLQVGALITIGCVLSVEPKIEEILKAMEKGSVPYKIAHASANQDKALKPDGCDDFEEGYSDDEIFNEAENPPAATDEKCFYFKSWILDICFKNLGWLFKQNEVMRCKQSAIPVMLESLQVLAAIAFHHLSSLLHSIMTLLADILSELLQHEHQDVVLHAARTISVIGDAIQKLEQTNEAPLVNHRIYMWEKLLTPLSLLLQSEGSPAKADVCDCIANIGETSFKELPSRQQMLCCALLVGSCSDEDPGVRAAAIRALAMTVMYRTLREDICFVSDCGENILRALKEPVVIIRQKAAWALGNLSDALVLNMDEPDIDCIDDDLLLRLLEASVHCVSDNDKVRMSATRALGNFLRLMKSDNLTRSTRLKNLCRVAIEKLLECAYKVTNTKVQWNACYALGNAMKNENLFTSVNGWQGKVFTSLCKQAQECKNLKVRINAAVALRACTERTQYGTHYALVWGGVMDAMENAANVDDFTEYIHKDNLIEQLAVTLAHLCCLLKQSDLTDILDPLVFHFDCAKSLLTQLYHKLAPENSSCLKILQAARYVTMDLTAAGDTQTQSLGMLQEMFVWDV